MWCDDVTGLYSLHNNSFATVTEWKKKTFLKMVTRVLLTFSIKIKLKCRTFVSFSKIVNTIYCQHNIVNVA